MSNTENSIKALLQLKQMSEKPLTIHCFCIEGGEEYKGYDYLIIFNSRGHRTAYVSLKDEDVKRFDDKKTEFLSDIDEFSPNQYFYPDISCHGGVTYYDYSHPVKKLLSQRYDDYWVGFDAFHCDDELDITLSYEYFPELKDRLDQYAEVLKDAPCGIDVDGDMFFRKYYVGSSGLHRTYEYMQEECKNIIEQLVELETKTENLDEPECHVSDGHIYASDRDEYRCKICGEFYR